VPLISSLGRLVRVALAQGRTLLSRFRAYCSRNKESNSHDIDEPAGSGAELRPDLAAATAVSGASSKLLYNSARVEGIVRA